MAIDELLTKIRELERTIAMDPKQVNAILLIKQYLVDSDIRSEVRLASLHSLRRLFMHFLESGILSGDEETKGSNDEEKDKKDKALKDYKMWVQQQYVHFKGCVNAIISSGDATMLVPAIRTVLECSRKEWLFQVDATNTIGSVRHNCNYGITCFISLVQALIYCEAEIDVDVLLMIRGEIFDKADCSYYGWKAIQQALKEAKRAVSADKSNKSKGKGKGSEKEKEKGVQIQRVEYSLSKTGISCANITKTCDSDILYQNCFDLLRIIPYRTEQEIGDSDLLFDKDQTAVEVKYQAETITTSVDDSDSEEDELDEVESEDEEEDLKPTGKRTRSLRGKARIPSKKAKAQRGESNQITGGQRVLKEKFHKKVFGSVWLTLLSLPLSQRQHKLVLKHMPEHVMGPMSNPLLLADYLYRAYECGGVIAILALQSLFTLIVNYNLDYPNFFTSLHDLCTVENFSAKYRAKFLKLLNASLKSVNIPAYLVAVFVKRLMQLSLLVPAHSASFCVMQATWLLRQHQQVIDLIHKEDKHMQGLANETETETVTVSSSAPTTHTDSIVSVDLCSYFTTHALCKEDNNYGGTSLWEAQGMKQHFLYSAATFASSLETAPSTSTGLDAPFLDVGEFLNNTYEQLITTELLSSRKQCAQAFENPNSLFGELDVVGGK